MGGGGGFVVLVSFVWVLCFLILVVSFIFDCLLFCFV